jgi:hypothetical protein
MAGRTETGRIERVQISANATDEHADFTVADSLIG